MVQWRRRGSKDSMNGKEKSTNKLITGQHVVLKNVLPETHIERLKPIAGKLDSIKSRPIYIANEKELGANTFKRYESAGLSIIFEKAAPLIKEMIGKQWQESISRAS